MAENPLYTIFDGSIKIIDRPVKISCSIAKRLNTFFV